MSAFLPFEKGLAELEGQIAELRANAQAEEGLEIEAEIRQLEKRVEARLDEIYGRLTPWQRCQIARHPRRPHSTDFAAALFEEFLPLAGDRAFAEDFAIIGGLVRFRGRSAVFIGQEKGRDTESRIQRNFGMARPEGYRKAIRLMDLADRFRLPVITSIDTPGAYPGRGAEERGQAEAIARTVEKGGLGVPSIAVILGEGGSGGAVALATANRVAVILGEGGSGGAVALATANRVLMLEHAVYSVISPEGCASILWRDSEKAESAAAALRLTASDLLRLGAIDRIVKEPRGGAHRGPDAALRMVGEALAEEVDLLDGKEPDEVRRIRREKFLAMGASQI